MTTPMQARAANANEQEIDVYSASHVYYGPNAHHKQHNHQRTRTYSTSQSPTKAIDRSTLKLPVRRGSHDETTLLPKRFLLHVDKTMKELEDQEATNGKFQITIEDQGPKSISLGTAASNGFNKREIRGNYVLANLLQELYLAKENGQTHIFLDESRINENPVNRLNRLIRFEYWDNLTRVIDGSVIEKAGRDPKDWTADPRARIYIPHGAPEQYEYYCQVAKDRPEIRLDVCLLPKKITPQYVQSLNEKPGLLAVAMEYKLDEKSGKVVLKGVPFVVPGGRFNEFYGWDSYMESLGLIASNKVHLAQSMVTNFVFCIKHYGKILNATRSYYLNRSQPPFLTDMALRVFDRIKHEDYALEFLKTATLAAMKEYESVWIAAPRVDKRTGLSRYRPEGLGVPPETEASHFTHILEPYAKKLNITTEEYVKGYNNGSIKEPELDDYFMHDRAVRESGHDTSYRLEKVCADLATIDLNCLLFKYEKDIASIIRVHFGDRLPIPAEFAHGKIKPGHIMTSSFWDRRARVRKVAIDKYLWNEEKGMFFDYNTAKKEQCTYESATTLWSLWSGVASPSQASRIVNGALPLFEEAGGLASGTEKSRGVISLDRPNRQWDHPYGWAPQQMLAWGGLIRYGYEEEAQRLVYKWLLMMTKAFVDYNGVVVEKYDVTRIADPHKVDAEYGNQGLDFKGVAKEGFGWVNASYVYGLQLITAHARRALGTLTDFDTFHRATVQVAESVDTASDHEDAINNSIHDSFDDSVDDSLEKHI
ncbi:probable neutral trehalase (alpha,alpha-trehalose glucohydrolase) [Rhynchosporium graminicola]|uniref:Trehalase n=1 Tax=Rhynchosporium graminicola TaxID=2792576 RepID=A0A1E1JQ86_9HELO|nr:probable neutral trehalase (alpha,alpha-trehalose glucohydrolase) [Rhynchosporium commune]